MGCPREEENLGAALIRDDLAGLDLRSVLPERGTFEHGEIADHQPVELGQPKALQPRVRRPDRRVLADQEIAEDLAVDHVQDGAVRAVVSVDPGQVVVAEVILRCGLVAPVLLEQRHHKSVGITPEAFWFTPPQMLAR